MNRSRRRNLKLILGQIEELTTIIYEVKEALQETIDEKKESLLNLPENLQESEQAEKMQKYIETIEEVINDLDELDMEDIYTKIEEITLE